MKVANFSFTLGHDCCIYLLLFNFQQKFFQIRLVNLDKTDSSSGQIELWGQIIFRRVSGFDRNQIKLFVCLKISHLFAYCQCIIMHRNAYNLKTITLNKISKSRTAPNKAKINLRVPKSETVIFLYENQYFIYYSTIDSKLTSFKNQGLFSRLMILLSYLQSIRLLKYFQLLGMYYLTQIEIIFYAFFFSFLYLYLLDIYVRVYSIYMIFRVLLQRREINKMTKLYRKCFFQQTSITKNLIIIRQHWIVKIKNIQYYDRREQRKQNKQQPQTKQQKTNTIQKIVVKIQTTREDNRYFSQYQIKDKPGAQLTYSLCVDMAYKMQILIQIMLNNQLQTYYKLFFATISIIFIFIPIFYPIFYKTNILIFNLLLSIQLCHCCIMNQKFSLNQYEVCVSFKSDNVLICSAEFLPTGQLFLSQTVELTRIKKDTVIATLQRKSQKHLKCQFEHLVGKDQKQLAIKFIVSYDFLPQFCEEVVLDFVQKHDKIKSLQVNNFKADITQMETMIDAFEKNGVWNFNEIASAGFTGGKNVELKTLDVTRGKYLLRVSGIYTNNTGVAGNKDTLTFKITAPGEKDFLKKQVTMNSVSGYSYPFSIQDVIDCKQGELKIDVQASGAQGTFTNVYIITCPIGDFK